MKLLRWLPVSIYAGLIFYLSSRTWSAPSALPEGADKVIHAVLYAALAFGVLWALRATPFKRHPHLIWIAVFICLLYGATDEFHQSLVPGRTPSAADLLADGLGSLIGAWIAVHTARRLRRDYALPIESGALVCNKR